MRTAAVFLSATLLTPAQVPHTRIERAHEEPGNWLTYSGTYSGQRYTPLNQITAANVAGLRPAWVYQTTDLNKFETTPLVVDGVMYISEPNGGAAALDARTGRPLWRYRRNQPGDLRTCCGRVNRGLAILDDALFMGTLDARLIALDAKTGRVRWEVAVADYKAGYSVTVAPLVVKDKVVVGISGGEWGIRGFLDAYDAKTGTRAWRFWTVAGPGDPGAGTWSGKSWKTGGAATWVTGSYDPELNLVYWGTGNPGPDYDGDVRLGDNLYSNSLVALDADTGKRKWHFQFTPHDVHDWDSNQVPVLVNESVRGQPRKLVVFANRNSFYYVLDRVTGEFLSGVEFAKQTWATGLDNRGRPIRVPDTSPNEQGIVVYPGMHGGTNWFSPSYSPLTKLLYVNMREEGVVFLKEKTQYKPGQWFAAGNIRGIPGVEPTGAIKALDVTTGKTVWEFPLRSPPWSGLLATAGGIVFGGSSEGVVMALDARSGKPLWHFPAGGPVFANPISFLAGGKQYFAITAGSALFAFSLAP